ncbi:MAG: hypothetical protein AB7N91_24930 [Candidatus Tectimicrobiota bacterium]
MSFAVLPPADACMEWPFPCSPADWAQTPPAVQASLGSVRQELAQFTQRLAVLEAQLQA